MLGDIQTDRFFGRRYSQPDDFVHELTQYPGHREGESRDTNHRNQL
jgi:hypothetical protein